MCEHLSVRMTGCLRRDHSHAERAPPTRVLKVRLKLPLAEAKCTPGHLSANVQVGGRPDTLTAVFVAHDTNRPQVIVLQRMKCFTMELAIKSKTYTGQEILAAAKLVLHPAPSSASEELHLLHCPNGVGSAPYLPLDAEVCLPSRVRVLYVRTVCIRLRRLAACACAVHRALLAS